MSCRRLVVACREVSRRDHGSIRARGEDGAKADADDRAIARIIVFIVFLYY